MPEKLHKTKGIVLRTVKFGETSLVVTIFTSLFGLQSYLVNGVRTATKKGPGKAGLFQPAALLELVVYHNELKQLNRIREFRMARLYHNIYSDVPRNAVSLFMVELLLKCLRQPEPNPYLFQFMERMLEILDENSGSEVANLPLYFALHLPVYFGFRIDNNFNESRSFLDLKEGYFVTEHPGHPHFLEEKEAAVSSRILGIKKPAELAGIKLGHEFRRRLLFRFENYYALHIPDFGSLKTLPVLSEVLE